MEMYKILCYAANDHTPDAYSGGTYQAQGEKYAAVNNNAPKLYKSKMIAERSAKSLRNSCANVFRYEIVGVTVE